MKYRRKKAITKVTFFVTLILAIGSIAFAEDRNAPCPDSSNTPPPISEGQKAVSNPGNIDQTTQGNQAVKTSPPGSLTPPKFKMMDEKKDEG